MTLTAPLPATSRRRHRRADAVPTASASAGRLVRPHHHPRRRAALAHPDRSACSSRRSGPRTLVDTHRLVDGVRPPVRRRRSGRSRTTATALDAEGFENAFLNSLAVAIPATVMPDHHRRLRRLRLLVDGVPRAAT